MQQHLQLSYRYIFTVVTLSGIKNVTDCDNFGALDDVLLPCRFLPVLPSTLTGVFVDGSMFNVLRITSHKYTAEPRLSSSSITFTILL